MSSPALDLVRSPTFLDELPASASRLRTYQFDLVQAIRVALYEGYKRILVQAPTGAGKTEIMAAIADAAVNAGLRVLVLAPRTRIVRQIHDRFEQFGVVHGVIAAALPSLIWASAKVQVASVDTLYRRCIVDARMPVPSADLVIFDEAHLSLGQTRVALLEKFPTAIHFGLTATPAKTSGRSLGERFDKLIIGPSVSQLIKGGFLAKPRIFSAPAVSIEELEAVTKDSTSGDFAVAELSALMARPKLVGDVLSNWLRLANGLPTIIFACDKSHGSALSQEFRQAGIAAELLTDQTTEQDREAAIFRLEQGMTTVLVNCFLLSYGIDIPTVRCIVLARPTRSLALYLQSVGRGLRTAPNKTRVTIIDHGRVTETLGLPDEEFAWSLDGKRNVNKSARADAKRRASSTEKQCTCPECAHVWLVSEDGPACDVCGWAPASKPKKVIVEEADLAEVGNDASQSAKQEEIEQFFKETCQFYANRWPDRWSEREARGRFWAWVQTKDRFKILGDRVPSRCWELPLAAVTASTAGHLKSRMIAYAKRAR